MPCFFVCVFLFFSLFWFESKKLQVCLHPKINKKKERKNSFSVLECWQCNNPGRVPSQHRACGTWPNHEPDLYLPPTWTWGFYGERRRKTIRPDDQDKDWSLKSEPHGSSGILCIPKGSTWSFFFLKGELHLVQENLSIWIKEPFERIKLQVCAPK